MKRHWLAWTCLGAVLGTVLIRSWCATEAEKGRPLRSPAAFATPVHLAPIPEIQGGAGGPPHSPGGEPPALASDSPPIPPAQRRIPTEEERAQSRQVAAELRRDLERREVEFLDGLEETLRPSREKAEEADLRRALQNSPR